ncbi:MAG TPA: sigma-70 family RNA polymerase sigma factor [Thermoanaerobaculia bacterium]|nr:sigma-70 family RNA polymerase sigma factor [Thermoanaerobaculia bacterium]
MELEPVEPTAPLPWERAALAFLGPGFAPALVALRSFAAWVDRFEVGTGAAQPQRAVQAGQGPIAPGVAPGATSDVLVRQCAVVTAKGSEGTRRPALEDVLPALCEQLRPQLRRILAAFQIPAEDAEDLVQTTLLIAVTKWTEIWNPAPWLLGTLEKRCIMYWRERRLRGARFVALEPIEHELSAEPPQERRVLLAEIEALCHRLPRRQHAVVAFYYYRGLRQREVASAAGLRQSSVRKTAHRAVAQLRQAVKGPAPGR